MRTATPCPGLAVDLPTALAHLRLELATCQDRLLERWSTLGQVEATISPLQHHGSVDDLTAERWADLTVRVGEDHQLAAGLLGLLRRACRVDAGGDGAPSLVTETLRTAIGHAASLTSCLEATVHTLRTAGPGTSGRGEAVAMCRRFLGSAQHDLHHVSTAVARAADLVPDPPARWYLRAVI